MSQAVNDNGAPDVMPPLSACMRIVRAADAISSIARILARSAPRSRWEGAAEGHADAAERLMTQAHQSDDLALRLTLLELAGQHALRARVFQAKAGE